MTPSDGARGQTVQLFDVLSRSDSGLNLCFSFLLNVEVLGVLVVVRRVSRWWPSGWWGATS